MNIRMTPEFDDWLSGLSAKPRLQVDDRLDRIEQHNHLGDTKDLQDGLEELRWKNGRRVYYSRVVDESGKTALILLGGDKNGQDKDIRKARKILDRETAETKEEE